MAQGSKQLVLLCVLALVPACAVALWHPNRPSWEPLALQPGEVEVQMILSWGDDVVFVDARPRVDYEQNHVPGAILLNEDEFEDQIDPLLQSWDLTSPIVVYCGSRVCQASHAVADRLRDEFGLEPVYVMKGGWSAWQSAVASRR